MYALDVYLSVVIYYLINAEELTVNEILCVCVIIIHDVYEVGTCVSVSVFAVY